MLATTTNWKDINKYYCGTYIKVPEVTDKVLLVHRVTTEGVYVQDRNDEKGIIELTGEGYQIQNVLPHKTYVQLFSSVCAFVSRIPARQWKRGICVENTQIWSLDRQGSFVQKDITFENLENLNENLGKFKSVSELKHPIKSLALSPRIAITIDGFIYCDTYCVGKYNRKKLILCLMKELMGIDLPINDSMGRELKITYV